MQIKIRVAQGDDATAACNALRRSINELCEADHGGKAQFLAGWLANKTPENLAIWIADPNNVFYVAVEQDAIAGVAAMNRNGNILLNYVSPDMRFRGVTKALLAALEDKARQLGLPQCTLESTKTALRFYTAAGYRQLQGMERGDCLGMIKNLAGS